MPKYLGPVVENLTKLLVNVTLKFLLKYGKYIDIFCWKNVSSFCIAKATHIFAAKNFNVFENTVATTVSKFVINMLVKRTMPWTTWLIYCIYPKWLGTLTPEASRRPRGSRGHGFESRCRQTSAHDCMLLHCTEPFIGNLTSSRYDLNNVERDTKHQIIIIIITLYCTWPKIWTSSFYYLLICLKITGYVTV